MDQSASMLSPSATNAQLMEDSIMSVPGSGAALGEHSAPGLIDNLGTPMPGSMSIPPGMSIGGIVDPSHVNVQQFEIA